MGDPGAIQLGEFTGGGQLHKVLGDALGLHRQDQTRAVPFQLNTP